MQAAEDGGVKNRATPLAAGGGVVFHPTILLPTQVLEFNNEYALKCVKSAVVGRDESYEIWKSYQMGMVLKCLIMR